MLDWILAVVLGPIIFIFSILFFIYKFFALIFNNLFGSSASTSQYINQENTTTNHRISSQTDYQSDDLSDECPPTCPSCGATMVRRTARHGAFAGSDFWGCSRYPHCSEIIDINGRGSNDWEKEEDLYDSDYDKYEYDEDGMSEINEMYEGFDPDLAERYRDDVIQYRRNNFEDYEE